MPNKATAKPKPQLGLEDKWIEDAELEELLEQRETLKTAVTDSRKATKAAKGKILAINFTGSRRCGRFIIGCSVSKPRSVAFDTEEGVRVTIKTTKEEQEAGHGTRTPHSPDNAKP
jgi:hypothetical protein